MSNKFSFKSTTYTGRTLYALIETDTATIIDGTTAVTYVSANYADYAITMTEQTRPGYWQGTTPAIADGWYTLTVKLQQGATPAESDPQVSQPTRGYWTGTVWDDPARSGNFTGLAQEATAAAIQERTDNLPDEPASVADVSLSVAPLVGLINKGLPQQANVELFQGEAKTLSWTILDQNGDPVSQAGSTHRLRIYTDNTLLVRLWTETSITISGTGNNVLTTTTTPASSATIRPGVYYYALIRIEGPEVVARGEITIKAGDIGA